MPRFVPFVGIVGVFAFTSVVFNNQSTQIRSILQYIQENALDSTLDENDVFRSTSGINKNKDTRITTSVDNEMIARATVERGPTIRNNRTSYNYHRISHNNNWNHMPSGSSVVHDIEAASTNRTNIVLDTAKAIPPPAAPKLNVVSATLPISTNATTTTTATAATESLPEDEEFSACLLIKDDNHRLPEWLAYHYFAMNLRYLVVAVDPHSVTSPKSIFDRWSDRITVVQWSDRNFTTDDLMIKANDAPMKRVGKHRARQRQFYEACMRYLHSEGRAWTSLHDVDEYLMIPGDLVGEDTQKQLSSQPGFLMKAIKDLRSNEGFPNAVKDWYKHFQQSHCITLARAAISAIESTEKEVRRGIPSFIEPMRFDTLRFRYQTSKRFRRDGPAKAIVDVSKITESDFDKGVNPHRPLRAVCGDIWMNFNKLPIGIYHYIGSFEQYSYREDARDGVLRSYDVWKDKALKQEGGADDYMRWWINPFVQLVGGEENAKYLLKDAGLPLGFQNSQTKSIIRNVTSFNVTSLQ